VHTRKLADEQVFAAGFVATRFAGPFNSPYWAYISTGSIRLALLLT
jgi:hypothetical protein